MKKTFLAFLLFALIAMPTGCYKDLGNYDYRELDEIVIDTTGTGTLSSYAVYRYDTLRISPKLYLNGNEVVSGDPDLECTWTIFQAVVGGTIYSRDTLSHSLALEAPITKPSGKWVVHLAVKDLKTDVETYFRTSVQVDETISDGWMVLYETEDGNTDVGLIVDDYVKTGVTKDRVFTGLFAGTNGRPMSGKPKNICHSAACLGSGEILIASENEFLGVDKISFEPTFPFKDLFWNAPEVQAPTEVIYTMYRKETVINNNRIHSANFMSSGVTRTNFFGEPARGDYGTLAEWSAIFPANSFDAIVYDQTNQRFLQLPYGGVEVEGFAEQDESLSAFDVNDVGMRMVVSDYGRNYYEYSLMEKNGKYSLLVSDFINSDPGSTGIGVAKYDMDSCPGISSACTLTGTLNGEYVYYGGGSGVYIFKYNSGSPAYECWEAPSGEEVTCIYMMKMQHQSIYQVFVPNPCQLIFIATYDDATGNGKVYEYLLDPANGSLDLGSERVRSGFGKIHKMCYKWSF